MFFSDEHLFWLLCDCHSVEHQVFFSWYEEDDEQMMYVRFHLEKQPLINRIKVAIKHVFGYQSRYGAFGEVIVNKQSAVELRGFIDEFIENAEGSR